MAESSFLLFSNVFLLGATFIVCLFLLDFMKSRKNGSHFPPGPRGLPFLGNILQVDYRNPAATFNQLGKQFGNVYSLQFFWTKMVVLNGFEVNKEALINRSEEIADRPRFPTYEKMGCVGDTKVEGLQPNHDTKGMHLRESHTSPQWRRQKLTTTQDTGNSYNDGIVVAHYGSSWKEQRRFALTTLRNFGMGKKSLEERVTEEAQFLCSEFKSQKDQFDPTYFINNAVSNVICSITFGDRFEYNDEKFLRLLRIFNAVLKAESGLLAQILNEIPFLNHIPWLVDRVMEPDYEMVAFLKEMIAEHRETWDPNYTRDFIDAYLVEMEKVKEDGSSSFNEANLLMTTYDLFIAGSETTGTTLRWAVLFMILYPDVQSKVQEEIDRIIGRERKPTMGDVLQMPYTNAVIHEVQRYGDIAPLGFPHMTYRDMEIKGYFIPKGTNIITNLSSVLKDHEVWEKPLQFYPKHFLDENGKFLKREAFIPFSAGRRACLGEQLARMELFLFFTTFLQQLTFEIPNDQPRPREDPFFAFTLSPQPYNIHVVARV